MELAPELVAWAMRPVETPTAWTLLAVPSLVLVPPPLALRMRGRDLHPLRVLPREKVRYAQLVVDTNL